MIDFYQYLSSLPGSFTVYFHNGGKFDYHYFQTEKSFISSVDQTKANKLGQELDITIDYDLQKGLKLQFEFDLFWPSDDWKGANSDLSTFSYITLTATI